MPPPPGPEVRGRVTTPSRPEECFHSKAVRQHELPHSGPPFPDDENGQGCFEGRKDRRDCPGIRERLFSCPLPNVAEASGIRAPSCCRPIPESSLKGIGPRLPEPT